MRRYQAGFVTFGKPCGEALTDLGLAYNNLADQYEEAWEQLDKAVEALTWYAEASFADRGTLARRVLAEFADARTTR